MKNVNLSALNTPENKKHGVAIFLAVFVGVPAFLWAAAFTINHLPTAKADKLSLQDSVAMSQADYDMGAKNAADAIASAQDSIAQYCETWKALALSKNALMEFAKVSPTVPDASIQKVNCQSEAKVYVQPIVPSSFL